MDELNNALRGKGQKNLDGMIKQTTSPFTAAMLDLPLPQKFGLSQLDSFNGSKDLLDRINLQKSDEFAKDPRRDHVQSLSNYSQESGQDMF